MFKKGEKAFVDFALGGAVVIVRSSHRVADGEIIYHVYDLKTGHGDAVGASYMRKVENANPTPQPDPIHATPEHGMCVQAKRGYNYNII